MMKQLPAHTRRLAQLVLQPGGITAQEAVAAAERQLEGLRERGLSDITATIHAVQALASGLPTEELQARGDELYRMSNSLIGIAGVFGKGGVGDVALSFCTLIERMKLARHWDRNAIQAHLDSLRLLSQDGVTQEDVVTIRAALKQVVDRLKPVVPPVQVEERSTRP